MRRWGVRRGQRRLVPLLVVLGFSLVGAVFEFLAWALAVGAVVFGGVGGVVDALA